MNDAKFFLWSKTIWIGIAETVIGILTLLGQAEWLGELSEPTAGWLLTIAGFLTVVVRFFTNQGVVISRKIPT